MERRSRGSLHKYRIISKNFDRVQSDEGLENYERIWPKSTSDVELVKGAQAKLRDGDISGAMCTLTFDELLISPDQKLPKKW